MDVRYRVSRPALLAAAVVSIAAFWVACGGGDDDDATPASGSPTTAASTPSASGTAGGVGGPDTLCLATAAPAPASVASPDLVEISGLAASQMNEGIVWAHNDSGDVARVFAVGLDGAHRGAFTLTGAEAIDWEDMGAGPGPDSGTQYLYLADIGDNLAQRPSVTIYRVAEPEVAASDLGGGGGELTPVDAIVLAYPDKPHDAETFFVDPEDGDMYIVTKEIAGGPSSVFRAPADAPTDATTTMEKVAEIDFAALPTQVQVPAGSPPLPSGLGHIPTGGDISSDGSTIAIRTYASVWVWPRRDGASIADAFGETPCEAPATLEPQGEAIAILPDGGGYVTVSEGANPPIHLFGE